jgi:hypothetical protein
MHVQGIRFHGGDSVRAALAPILDHLASLYWIIDLQGGVWSRGNRPEYETINEEIGRYRVGPSLYRPGVLPRFIDHLNVDEWSYYYGLAGEFETAIACAGGFSRHSTDFLERPPSHVVLGVICVCPGCHNHPGGDWAVFSKEAPMLAALTSGRPHRAIDSLGCTKHLDGPWDEP